MLTSLLPTALPVAAMVDVVLGLVMVFFVLSTLLLMLVILMQEGKGGGVAGVFGGGFTETFGVKAGTVNRFTAYLAAAFLGLALLHAGVSARRGGTKLADLPTLPADGAPATPGLPGGLPGIEVSPPADGAPAVPPADGAPAGGNAGDPEKPADGGAGAPEKPADGGAPPVPPVPPAPPADGDASGTEGR